MLNILKILTFSDSWSYEHADVGYFSCPAVCKFSDVKGKSLNLKYLQSGVSSNFVESMIMRVK